MQLFQGQYHMPSHFGPCATWGDLSFQNVQWQVYTGHYFQDKFFHKQVSPQSLLNNEDAKFIELYKKSRRDFDRYGGEKSLIERPLVLHQNFIQIVFIKNGFNLKFLDQIKDEVADDVLKTNKIMKCKLYPQMNREDAQNHPGISQDSVRTMAHREI